MPAFTIANDFVEDLANGVHDLDTHQLVIALSNTAPASEISNPLADGNGLLANVTQIAYTNLSTRNITFSSDGQTSGTYKLVLTDLTLSASGGAVADFRYIYIYNDTTTVKTDPLIGMVDYGGTVSLANGESIDIDFDAANGLLQIAIV